MKEDRESADVTLNYGMPGLQKSDEKAPCAEKHWYRKIYSRSGDRGGTSLPSGGKTPTHDLRIITNGLIDELNSWIGYVRSINRDIAIDAILAVLQPKLNVLCSDIAAPMQQDILRNKFLRIEDRWTNELESEMARMEKDLEILVNPVLPGGSPAAASLHSARTVCRRAALALWFVQDTEGNVNPEVIRYVNRLSDFLFLLAQWANLRFLRGDS